jgi:cytochrome c
MNQCHEKHRSPTRTRRERGHFAARTRRNFLSFGHFFACPCRRRGKRLYECLCVGCHSLDENRAGPAHRGVFGRRAGRAPGYDYSPAVKNSKITWNEKTLDRWLADRRG